jgi:hypothetical protein
MTGIAIGLGLAAVFIVVMNRVYPKWIYWVVPK